MADLTGYPFVRHLRGTPTGHVRHVRHGKLVHDGTGLSFWCRPRSAVLSEIPVDDRELPMLGEARAVRRGPVAPSRRGQGGDGRDAHDGQGRFR